MAKNLDPQRLQAMIDRAVAHAQHVNTHHAPVTTTPRPWGMAIAASVAVMVLSAGIVMTPEIQRGPETTVAWSEPDWADDLFWEIFDETI